MKKAFYNICSLLNNRAVLFVDGMDLDLREKLSRKMNLHPLQYKIEAIHKEAQNARAIGWPYNYWGLEPFNASRGDWQRKYATIYFSDN